MVVFNLVVQLFFFYFVCYRFFFYSFVRDKISGEFYFFSKMMFIFWSLGYLGLFVFLVYERVLKIDFVVCLVFFGYLGVKGILC